MNTEKQILVHGIENPNVATSMPRQAAIVATLPTSIDCRGRKMTWRSVMPRHTWSFSGFFVGGAIALLSPGLADEHRQEGEPGFLGEFRALRQKCDEECHAIQNEIEAKFEAAIASGNAQEEERLRQSLHNRMMAIITPTARETFELVKPHASEPCAAEALAWIAHYDGEGEPGEMAAALLIKHHVTRQAALDLVDRQRLTGKSWVEPMLRAQLVSADLPEAQRPVKLRALAECLKQRADAAGLNPTERDKLDKEAVAFFEQLGEKYADIEILSGVTYGELAESSLFEIRNLRVGKTAPDIEGEDLEGIRFRLSDYRGKVVMLRFWAGWCEACTALRSEELKLVERYQARPFALVGVNCDMDRETLSAALGDQKTSWRSFWSGEKGPFGPIPRAWNITSWPTTYLIDASGIIRAKAPGRLQSLDATIEQLVRETEAGN
jgi:thiol-disulfide isomerase/thioredoxin